MHSSLSKKILEKLACAKKTNNPHAKEALLKDVFRLDPVNAEAWNMLAELINKQNQPVKEFQGVYMRKHPEIFSVRLPNPNPSVIVLPKRKSTTNRKWLLTLLIPMATAVTVAFITKLPDLLLIISPTQESSPIETSLKIRIASDKNIAVQGARVVFTTDQGIYPQFSDINGNASITVSAQKKEGRLFVETGQYAVYDQIIPLPMNDLVDVRLSPRDPNNRNVIIRVSNRVNCIPVEGAEITLIVSGKIYSQPTDSNGITKFLFEFGDKNELDADISIKTVEYAFEHQRITLQADRLQDVLIDPNGISLRSLSYIPTLTATPTPFPAPTRTLTQVILPTSSPITPTKFATAIGFVTILAFTFTPTYTPTPPSPTIITSTHTPITPNTSTYTPTVTNTSTYTPTFTPIPPPTSPSLTLPSHNSIIIGNGITYTWNPGTNSSEYFLEYTGASIGNSGWTTALSYSASSLPVGIYTWRVKARNLAGESLWSELWTVTIQAPADIWVHVQGSGFEFTGTSGTGGWVEIRTQNTINSSIDPNVIYTQTRAIGATNDADWVRWRPGISTPGYYRACIFAPWYTNSRGITNMARYLIHHANGDSTPPEYPTRQSDFSNSWMDMGRYQFNSDSSGYIYMGDYTGDNPIRLISADAAKFIWSPTGAETCQ